MNDILKTLCDAFEPVLMSEKEKAIRREAEPVLSAAEGKLTATEWDTLWDTARQTACADGEDLFAIGFRLGVQLTLTGLGPVGEKQK